MCILRTKWPHLEELFEAGGRHGSKSSGFPVKLCCSISNLINHEKPPQTHINSTTPSSEIQKMQETLTVDKVKAETVIDNLYNTMQENNFKNCQYTIRNITIR